MFDDGCFGGYREGSGITDNVWVVLTWDRIVSNLCKDRIVFSDLCRNPCTLGVEPNDKVAMAHCYEPRKATTTTEWYETKAMRQLKEAVARFKKRKPNTIVRWALAAATTIATIFKRGYTTQDNFQMRFDDLKKEYRSRKK